MNNDLHEKFGTQTAQTCYLFIYLFFWGGGGGGWGLGEEECASFRKVPKSLKSHKIYVYPTYN